MLHRYNYIIISCWPTTTIIVNFTQSTTQFVCFTQVLHRILQNAIQLFYCVLKSVLHPLFKYSNSTSKQSQSCNFQQLPGSAGKVATHSSRNSLIMKATNQTNWKRNSTLYRVNYYAEYLGILGPRPQLEVLHRKNDNFLCW